MVNFVSVTIGPVYLFLRFIFRFLLPVAGNRALPSGMLVVLTCGSAYPGSFDALKNMRPEQRIAAADEIFQTTILSSGPEVADQEFLDLTLFARNEKDGALEVHGYLLWGDYYIAGRHELAKAFDKYQAALKAAISRGKSVEIASATYRMGKYHFREKSYAKAFEYLLSADEMVREISYDKFPAVNNFLLDMGRAYYEFGDYPKAKEYFGRALLHPYTHSPNAIEINNTLALTYKQLGATDSSILFFEKALAFALQEKDSAWIGITSGNLGSMYADAGEYERAMPLLRTDYQLSVQNQQWNSAATCLLLMAEIMIRNDSLATAEKFIEEAEAYSSEMKSTSVMANLHLRKADLFRQTGNFKSAYESQRLAALYADSTLKEKDRSLLKQAEVKISTEKYLAEKKLRSSEQRKQQLMRNAGMVILFLILVLFYALYNRQQLRRKKDSRIFELEKKRFEQELQNSKLMLQSYMDNLLEKNQMIEHFKSEMEQMQHVANPALVAEREQLIEKLYHSAILTEDDWTEFRRLFEKVHTSFFEHLREKYPDLTLAETRLLALTKLNLSVNEMANMLGISPNSVRKTSLRLRKKLNLDNPEELVDLVAKL